jgi:hypothetical protein
MLPVLQHGQSADEAQTLYRPVSSGFAKSDSIFQSIQAPQIQLPIVCSNRAGIIIPAAGLQEQFNQVTNGLQGAGGFRPSVTTGRSRAQHS